jgi:hypothetical protein
MPNRNDQKRRCPHCSIGKTSNMGVWLGPLVYAECDRCGYKLIAEHPHREAVSDLANALQVALCVSTTLGSQNKSHGNDLRKLQDTLKRAVTALNKLRGN